MNKLKTSRLAQLKALLIVPLVACLLVAFANPQTSAQAGANGKPITITGQVIVKTTAKDCRALLSSSKEPQPYSHRP